MIVRLAWIFSALEEQKVFLPLSSKYRIMRFAVWTARRVMRADCSLQNSKVVIALTISFFSFANMVLIIFFSIVAKVETSPVPNLKAKYSLELRMVGACAGIYIRQ
jgi:hypothetical protein